MNRRRRVRSARMAAMRSREKRKKWLTELRDKYQKMCVLNEALVREVNSLREEVTRLKEILLEHKECPSFANQIVTVATVPDMGPMPSPSIPFQGRSREGLHLDIDGASRNMIMDLDSPLVRRDEILTSVAPPITPNERLIIFPDLTERSDSDNSLEVMEERQCKTVIQINPNALVKASTAFS